VVIAYTSLGDGSACENRCYYRALPFANPRYQRWSRFSNYSTLSIGYYLYDDLDMLSDRYSDVRFGSAHGAGASRVI
jgi:hypothetical protein